MISANELRIGNLVLCNGEIDTIVAIDSYRVCGDLKTAIKLTRSSPWLNNLEPIPLTEEWLVKFGGEIKPFSIGILIDRFRFIWKEDYKYFYIVDKYAHTYLTKIEWVHELQNFYKAMNGQELNITI